MESGYRPRILIVDDDVGFTEAASALAELSEISAICASTLEDARRETRNARFDLLLVDLTLPDGSGFDLIQDLDPAASGPIAIVTGSPSIDSAALAVRMPVLDYLVKPLKPDVFRDLLSRISVDCREVHVDGCGELIGRTPGMREIFRQIHLVAMTDATVLVHGESGTGKELVAGAIHALSDRKGAFVAVNCGAVAPELLASQLFGHERGSFTGALRRHQGYFEQASGGTLFLDEISEMPLSLQSHLLRVLETRRIERLGGEGDHAVDVRVIAATNRDPREAVAKGHLREDLYYRLTDFPISLPPLRQRLADVMLIAQSFLDRLNKRYVTRKRFSASAARALMIHDWPGNVRELRNVIQRAFILSDSNELAIPPLRERRTSPLHETDTTVTFAVGTPLEEIERRMLVKTLAHFQGDKTETARALGVSIKTIYNWLARDEARC